MSEASRNGQVQVLDWIHDISKTSGQKRSITAIEFASQNGHKHVLDWRKQSGMDGFGG